MIAGTNWLLRSGNEGTINVKGCNCEGWQGGDNEGWIYDSGQKNGAGNGTRTRDINLGKVALYQLSYSRSLC